MKKLSILIAVALLGGCLGGFSQPSRFYSLTQVDTPAKTYTTRKISIGIEPVKIPVYLDKPQIVNRDANNVELDISELNRWAEPLSNAMQSTLAADIGAILPNALVKASSYRPEGFAYTVWVEVNKFEGSWNEDVTLDAWWSIFNSDNKLVAQNRFVLKRQLGKGYDNLVLQQSELLGELAQIIAAKLATLAQ